MISLTLGINTCVECRCGLPRPSTTNLAHRSCIENASNFEDKINFGEGRKKEKEYYFLYIYIYITGDREMEAAKPLISGFVFFINFVKCDVGLSG